MQLCSCGVALFTMKLPIMKLPNLEHIVLTIHVADGDWNKIAQWGFSHPKLYPKSWGITPSERETIVQLLGDVIDQLHEALKKQKKLIQQQDRIVGGAR